MRIADLLAPDAVLELTGTTPAAVLAELAAPVARAHQLDPQQLAGALAERERLGSTGVGEGVAIPHARVRGLPGLAACLGRARQGLDFKALDGKPARLFLALFAPESSAGTHLQALARVSRIFKSPTFREQALAAPDAAALRRLLAEEDARVSA
jgi:PTS system nitrogen regulatory IIA component